ncbi:hypothetical protein QZH41_001781 [Actinostola sp. cb2023]|nr:hypothetical protein QZH41_001781 [Actinostola sp. cb2023]
MAYYNPRRWSLHCNSCKGLLGTHDTIMLAIVPPSQQHLSVKQGCEEIAAKTLRKIDVLEDNPKKSKRSLFRLLCQNCNAKVGSVESIEGQELMCLKSEAVLLRDIFDSEKHEKKLKNLIPALEKCSIEKVTISFLPRNHRCTREPATAVVYCDTSQLSRQEINSLTLQNPRDYQVELFTYAMHGNSLVFLPTGSGKTLVAAMAISCMKKLNPRKLAVFIVDRIPLAHQQAEYIKAQVSGLKVSLLVGECNGNEPSMMKNLNDLAEKKTEVLVLTHQIFLNMLSDEHGAVQLSDVCLLVIDEAHHCQGNHPFNQIMRDHYPKLLPDKFKPLVLALTASPAGEIGQKETLESLQGLLKRLCSSARMPVKSQDLAMHTNKPQTFYKVIPLTSYQLCLQTAIEKYLKTIASLLVHRYHANNAEIAALSPQTPNYRGCLRQITGQCHDDENWDGYALSELAMHLLGVLEINNVLGINLAIECLQECFDLIDNESTPTERRKKRILQREGNFDEFKTQVKTIQLYSSFTPSQPHEKFSYLVEELKMFSLQTEKDGTSRGIVL